MIRTGKANYGSMSEGHEDSRIKVCHSCLESTSGERNSRRGIDVLGNVDSATRRGGRRPLNIVTDGIARDTEGGGDGGVSVHLGDRKSESQD